MWEGVTNLAKALSLILSARVLKAAFDMTYFFPHQPALSDLHCYFSYPNYSYLNILTF